MTTQPSPEFVAALLQRRAILNEAIRLHRVVQRLKAESRRVKDDEKKARLRARVCDLQQKIDKHYALYLATSVETDAPAVQVENLSAEVRRQVGYSL